jgi:hypothetical protein
MILRSIKKKEPKKSQISQKDNFLRNKIALKQTKVVLVDLKYLINLDKNHFSKTKSFSTASLIRLKNLEKQFKNNAATVKKSYSLEFQKLLDSFQINKDQHQINSIELKSTCLLQIIKYDRLSDDKDDLNISFESNRLDN